MLSYDGGPIEAIAYFLGREILVCVDWESCCKGSKLLVCVDWESCCKGSKLHSSDRL
jgi:hypothetical protein